jgi:hypothetical protein
MGDPGFWKGTELLSVQGLGGDEWAVRENGAENDRESSDMSEREPTVPTVTCGIECQTFMGGEDRCAH